MNATVSSMAQVRELGDVQIAEAHVQRHRVEALAVAGFAGRGLRLRATRSTRAPRRSVPRRILRAARPVPKQSSHQPCLELNENRRGSSSAKLVPQEGQARLMLNTCTLGFFAGNRDRARAPGPCPGRAPDDIALERVGAVLLHVDLRHRQLDGVLLEAVEARPLHGGQHLAVDAQLFVAARVGPLGELGVVALARHHQRRQQQDADALVLLQQALGDGPRGLRLDGHVAGGAELRAELHVQQAQEVIDLGERGHRALAAAAAGALLDGHRGRNAVDGVDVRARRRLHELARIGVQRFEIAALAFVEDDVEGERGFSRARHARDHRERLARNRARRCCAGYVRARCG